MRDQDYDFFLEHDIFGKKQVTKEEWISAERFAGFHPKYGGDGFATSGFFGNGISGYFKLKSASNKISFVKVHPDRKTFRDELTAKGIL